MEDLTHDLIGLHHVVNCDNSFTSPELLLSLLRDGILVQGTVRSNRKGMPLQVSINKTVEVQGYLVTLQKGGPGCSEVA